MSETVRDLYPQYYADKLWDLLPEVYRSTDTDAFGTNGPLREMVNRIGATAAELRRGIDRMWEDQSIETCDDWVIPYIAKLLDTHLVLGLDPRGQRLDVANTIDYRRRKGTLALLEQLASDITSWDAKAVEFFHRLGRTRHGLDPPIGPAAAPGDDLHRLRLAEGLTGRLTGTMIGGFANLRNVYGARKARSAFDEFFYTADTRAGVGTAGWYAMPHLGVFVWRLLSLPTGPVTPVPVLNCPGWFTFDPTGRDVPLFAPRRDGDRFGDHWVSPTEGQLPGPISRVLLYADIALGANGVGLYASNEATPGALSVWDVPGSPLDLALVSPADLTLRPEQGRFARDGSPPPADVVAHYCYGFPSLIGAGPYDRRGRTITIPTPTPENKLDSGGLLTTARLNSAPTVTLGDSLTYPGIDDLHVPSAAPGSLTLRAANEQRPLIRLPADQPWTITGDGPDASLTLDGLFISGQDIVLSGQFASVTLTCCTLDPGSAGPGDIFAGGSSSPPASLFIQAADGRDLVPTRLWVEAQIGTLSADRCVLGPIRTRSGGVIETVTISNSIVQAIRSTGIGAFAPQDVKDPDRFVRLLQLGLDPVSAWVRSLMDALASPPFADPLGSQSSPPLSAPVLPPTVLGTVLIRLNQVLAGPLIYRADVFNGIPLSAETTRQIALVTGTQPAPALNRLLLEDAFPLELADAALAFGDGVVQLSCCTILGRIAAHRLDTRECILHELAQADDRQDGCIRFSAWSSGSLLPRQYESVAIPQTAGLFTSTVFGAPGYAQLLPTADLRRLPPAVPPKPGDPPQNKISAGAEDGSEMGAYARDRNPIRARALLLKLQEYMPAGLAQVVVNAT